METQVSSQASCPAPRVALAGFLSTELEDYYLPPHVRLQITNGPRKVKDPPGVWTSPLETSST